MDTAVSAPAKSEEPEEEVVNPYGMLLQADRCDTCGSQAFVRVVHPTIEAWHGVQNQDLLFCGHHFAKAQASGKLEGWTVLDERARIN